MNTFFSFNDNIPYKDISTSMQLDSRTEIAVLQQGGITLLIRVIGDVKVFYNPNPEGSWEDEGAEMYKSACQFPDELWKLFGSENVNDLENLHVVNNNWFELTVYKKGQVIFSDVIEDIEGPECLDPSKLFTYLVDALSDIKKDYADVLDEADKESGTEDVSAADMLDKIKANPSDDVIHETLHAYLYDEEGNRVGRLNDLHFEYDARDGRNGGLVGSF